MRSIKNRKAYFILRWSIYMLGVILLAFGIVLTIIADIGTACWEVLHIGLFLTFGLTIGTWSILVGMVVITISSLLMKAWPQIGALINMFLVGIFIDIFMLIPYLETPETFIYQMIMLIAGIVIMGFGIGLYISPNCGAGPRDSLMLALTTIFKIKVQYARGVLEIIVLFLGWLLGGPVFIGTFIYTFMIGPVIGFALPRCQKVVTHILGDFDPNGRTEGVSSENINETG